MQVCSVLPSGAGFISSMTGYIDCQAQALGSGAWSALAAPGSTVQVVLTGFLTIFIALIGYNLLLGQGLTVRSGTLAFLKIGAVFALGTSWPAYRTLIYDLVADGPSQLVAEIGPQAGIAGSDGTLTQRLDGVDRALAQLAILGPGNPPPTSYAQIPPAPFGGFDAFALGGSRILFELTALAGLGIVRVITGLMLALGPFFIAFLMFESTRSLFEGWVRVLGGAGLAAVGVAVALGLQLALIEPWLGNALARRMAGEALPTISTELFVITGLFSMVVAGVLYACARVVQAFRLAPALRTFAIAQDHRTALSSSPATAERARDTVATEHSRATAIATFLAAWNRRDRIEPLVELGRSGRRNPRMPMTSSSDRVHRTTPVGRSFNRRPNARVSALASRRDSSQ